LRIEDLGLTKNRTGELSLARGRFILRHSEGTPEESAVPGDRVGF
jgi:hypothetical protein